jgi:hypothetical protein
VNDEIEVDLAAQILARLADKAAKRYPPNTVLIMQCYCNTLTLDTEWEEAIRRVKAAQPAIPFREVFLIENAGMSHPMLKLGGGSVEILRDTLH